MLRLQSQIEKLKTLENRYVVTQMGLKRIYTGPLEEDPYKKTWLDLFDEIDYRNPQIFEAIRDLNQLVITEAEAKHFHGCTTFIHIKHVLERRLKGFVSEGRLVLALFLFDDAYVKFENAVKCHEEYRLLFKIDFSFGKKL
jgi:hypothetical protein